MSSVTAVSGSTRRHPASPIVTVRPHVHGIDRVIMRLGLALVLWARKRSARNVGLHVALTHEQQQLRVEQARALTQRERDLALLDYHPLR